MAEPTRFVVRRLNWRPAGDAFIRLPGETRLASFDTFDDAEADRIRREHEVRGRVNPFRCGTAFHTLTTLPEPVFADWVADAGLTPPERPAVGFVDWAAWWAAGHATWTEEQRARVWDGLNHVRFFEVIERPPSAVAYAVVRVMWEYNDNWYEPGAEGGRTVIAYRSREAAERRRAELEAGAEDRPSYVETGRWRHENWPAIEGDGSVTEFGKSGAPMYEVVEIDLGGVGR